MTYTSHYGNSFCGAGWALYNQFRPVMRKPTIQAKPKINKPVIPVGGKIVSTISAQTYQATANEKAATATTSPPVTLQNAISLKTSTDDVNGFADLPSNAKVTYKRFFKESVTVCSTP